MKKSTAVTMAVIAAALVGSAVASPARPYEFEWANRTHDDFPPVLPLTDAKGWRVEATNTVASFTGSVERALFGDGVARLTFRATGPDAAVRLVPPQPVALPEGFDTLGIWAYVPEVKPDRRDLRVQGYADILDGEGRPLQATLGRVAAHLEWFYSRRRLAPEEIARVRTGAKLVSFTFKEFKQKEDRVVELTSFSAFRDPLAPLKFKPRAKRGVQIFPDEPQGVNTGEGRLPFPDRETTVLPPCAGEDPRLEFRLPSDPLRWDELAFRWKGGEWIGLASGGGLFPSAANARVSFRRVGNSVVADIVAPAGDVEEARFGTIAATGAAERLLVPYWNYRPKKNRYERPAVILLRSGGTPLFVSATPDWTQSAASEPFCEKDPAVLSAHGGMRYIPKTDGARNGCFERFIWTVSPDFAATLPTIPNPVSPWKRVAGKGVWHPHGASAVRENDLAFWRKTVARGMKHLIVTDHESGWRDGHESFTFRLRTAPGKGGDASQAAYASAMTGELGLRYGPYNNFTDFAPVNGLWNPDNIARLPDGNFKYAWYRCYGPKPVYAVEMCEKLSPLLAQKFAFNTGYCDVHTAVTPWSRTDYDARVPGAGTFAQTFYAYGEIMMLQKKAWNGPVYSEGSTHWMYCGLTDGNYAQDQEYNLADNPWLLDFDLLRMHPLCCNFGMGSRSMFFAGKDKGVSVDVQHDRFICATLAFGHSGFLAYGDRNMERSYFLVQALAERYTQADVASIRYVDAAGRLFDTSAALANGVWRRSQVVVRYTDGTLIAANGSKTEEMAAASDGTYPALPPNGFFGRSGDGQAESFSARRDGKLVERAVSPEYRYTCDESASVCKIELL